MESKGPRVFLDRVSPIWKRERTPSPKLTKQLAPEAHALWRVEFPFGWAQIPKPGRCELCVSWRELYNCKVPHLKITTHSLKKCHVFFQPIDSSPQGFRSSPWNPEMFAQMSAPSRGGETIQESLLLLAYERFQQSQQRQPLASLPMGVLAIRKKCVSEFVSFS